ncbi:hypothetical protein L596_014178 [Steinernema carpocapsae]|uniref:Uncharacterized protein n=1 Tax=Steinernema carpocapsae TaxID=34508 RepID=A0A4U5NC40_STECR|nr:hypothetical protein L596_014178 [Steinernema carpocapsae]
MASVSSTPTKVIQQRLRRLFVDDTPKKKTRRRSRATEGEEDPDAGFRPKKRRSSEIDADAARKITEEELEVDETILHELQTNVKALFKPPCQDLCEESLKSLMAVFRVHPSIHRHVCGEILQEFKVLVDSKDSYRKYFGFYKSPVALPFILLVQAAAKKDLCTNKETEKTASCKGFVKSSSLLS